MLECTWNDVIFFFFLSFTLESSSITFNSEFSSVLSKVPNYSRSLLYTLCLAYTCRFYYRLRTQYPDLRTDHSSIFHPCFYVHNQMAYFTYQRKRKHNERAKIRYYSIYQSIYSKDSCCKNFLVSGCTRVNYKIIKLFFID